MQRSHLVKIDNETNNPTDFLQQCRLSVGLLFPQMFPLIHSVRDVYMAQYDMNVFLELSKNYTTFQKVTGGHFCSRKVT